MNIVNVSYTKIDWDKVPITKYSGETGNAYSRTIVTGNIRIRLVEYSPGYKADHWCCRGHIIHLLEGEMVLELKDGTCTALEKDMSCIVGDDQNPHRSFTKKGAFLLIID